MYQGSWKIDDLLTFTVNTHDAATGAETDADAAPTYRIYEDETGTAILTGTMALLDDANTVGHYSEQITLSAANGFEKGKSYNIRIRGVVGGVAGATTRTFQMEAEVDANVVSDKTGYGLSSGERTTLVAAIEAEIADDATGEAVKQAIIDKLIENLPDLDDLSLAAIATAVRDVNNSAPAANSLGAVLNARASQTSVDDIPTVAEFEARTIVSANYATSAAVADLPTNAELATALGTADDAVLAAIAALNNITVAAVAAQITSDHGAGSYQTATSVTVSDKTGFKLASDGLNLVVPADPSAVPVLGTASIVAWIGWFGAWCVNEVNVTATQVNLRNSADNDDMATHTISDDGTTFSSSEPS